MDAAAAGQSLSPGKSSWTPISQPPKPGFPSVQHVLNGNSMEKSPKAQIQPCSPPSPWGRVSSHLQSTPKSSQPTHRRHPREGRPQHPCPAGPHIQPGTKSPHHSGLGWMGQAQHRGDAHTGGTMSPPLLRAPAVGSPQRNPLYTPHPSILQAPISIQHRPILHGKQNQFPAGAGMLSALTGVNPKLHQPQIHNGT